MIYFRCIRIGNINHLHKWPITAGKWHHRIFIKRQKKGNAENETEPVVFVSKEMDNGAFNALQSAYPEIKLVVTNLPNHPHEVARVARICARQSILRRVDAHRPYIFKKKRNSTKYELPRINIINIGGNVVRDLLERIHTIHNCTATIDFKDSARKTQEILEIKKIIENKTIPKEVGRMYMPGACNRFRCSNGAENCTLKADYGVAIHSLYDIPLDLLGTIIDKHEIKILYACIIFDPSILVLETGEIQPLNIFFEKRYINGIKKIFFGFIDDPSLNYSQQKKM